MVTRNIVIVVINDKNDNTINNKIKMKQKFIINLW